MAVETGLTAYLANKAKAMFDAAKAFGTGTAVRETISAECTASNLTGVRQIRIRQFQILSDSGPSFGGYGLGPNSPELLLGALSSCLTHTYLIGAARRNISLDKVQVRFEAENNDAAFLGLATEDPPYPFNIRAVVKVESQASPEELIELHDYAARTCPLTKLVRDSLSVQITVEVG